MTKWFYVLTLAIFLGTNVFAQNTQKKPTMLFVGMKHLDWFEDIFSPKRQKEVEEVVELLEKFRPTKIAVEIPTGDDKVYNEDFKKYLRGEYKLGPVETRQIAFRLAKQLHHEKIYPVDYKFFADLPSLDSFALANHQEIYTKRLQDRLDEIFNPVDERQNKSSILQVLQAYNTDSIIEKLEQALLSSYVHIGKDTNYLGADHLTDWYKRNLRIYTNIVRIIDSDDDRVLVLIGAFHMNSLLWFSRGSGEYVVEKADKYLK